MSLFLIIINIYFLLLGAFRKGKSFLLNFMLRYLRAGGKEEWISTEDELTGFTWRYLSTLLSNIYLSLSIIQIPYCLFLPIVSAVRIF